VARKTSHEELRKRAIDAQWRPQYPTF
jgi:hypothetical protein